MTLAELRAAVKARGFQDLTDAQVDQLVNDAVTELDSMFPWPYREASATGVAPVAIADLGEVDVVLDTSTSFPLQRAAWSELASTFGDTTVTGSPEYWFLGSVGGVFEIGVYPGTSGQIAVQYWRTSPTLVADSDTPLAPPAWHGVYVDIAAGAGYPDGETPPGLQARIDRRVNDMVNALMADYGPSMVSADGVDC